MLPNAREYCLRHCLGQCFPTFIWSGSTYPLNWNRLLNFWQMLQLLKLKCWWISFFWEHLMNAQRVLFWYSCNGATSQIIVFNCNKKKLDTPNSQLVLVVNTSNCLFLVLILMYSYLEMVSKIFSLFFARGKFCILPEISLLLTSGNAKKKYYRELNTKLPEGRKLLIALMPKVAR